MGTNALEVQSYLFVLNWEKFGAFFWIRVRFKNFLGPTYVSNQLWFLKYTPIFLFLLVTFGASFALFFGPLGLLFLLFWAIYLALFAFELREPIFGKCIP